MKSTRPKKKKKNTLPPTYIRDLNNVPMSQKVQIPVAAYDVYFARMDLVDALERTMQAIIQSTNPQADLVKALKRIMPTVNATQEEGRQVREWFQQERANGS